MSCAIHSFAQGVQKGSNTRQPIYSLVVPKEIDVPCFLDNNIIAAMLDQTRQICLVQHLDSQSDQTEGLNRGTA